MLHSVIRNLSEEATMKCESKTRQMLLSSESSMEREGMSQYDLGLLVKTDFELWKNEEDKEKEVRFQSSF